MGYSWLLGLDVSRIVGENAAAARLFVQTARIEVLEIDLPPECFCHINLNL
jgi:hypothetical protein